MFLNAFKSLSSPAVLKSVSMAVGSQRTSTEPPAQKTRQKRKRSISGQVSNPSEHQGCKETDQPSYLADTTEPQQKRPRAETGPEEPADQPVLDLSEPCWTTEYLMGELLGKGGYGSVFAGTRIVDGLPVAIKFVPKRNPEKKLQLEGYGSMPFEVALMVLANIEPCSNVLKILNWFEEEEHYVLFLERPEPCMDLFDFTVKQGGCLTEVEARTVMPQLIKALKHCKRQGIVHRDVKPENILIQTDTWEIKLFDFGCGDLVKDLYSSFAGTREFAPPEWFVQGQYRAEPATVWSVGVTLYDLVCGSQPFTTPEEIIAGHLSFPESLSEDCRDLIQLCLSPDAEDRPSLEALELHHWFSPQVSRRQGPLDGPPPVDPSALYVLGGFPQWTYWTYTTAWDRFYADRPSCLNPPILSGLGPALHPGTGVWELGGNRHQGLPHVRREPYH